MHLIFDFDGTLVNSFDCVMGKTKQLAKEFHFRKIADHEEESLRDLSSKDLIRFLKIPLYKIPMLIYQMRKHLRDEIPKLLPVPKVYETLEKLYQAKYHLGILTSNSVENVMSWLDLNQMRPFFSFIHSESRYFSKKNLLKKIIKKYQLDQDKTIYIGDETRDIQAAQQNHIKSIAVTWGYNSEKALLKYEPTWVIRKPEELLTTRWQVVQK